VPEEEATKVSLPFFFERVACLIQNFMLVCMVVAAILTSLLSLPFFIYLDSAPQLFFFLKHVGELRIIVLVEEKRSHT
jgi:hypothetical protein